MISEQLREVQFASVRKAHKKAPTNKKNFLTRCSTIPAMRRDSRILFFAMDTT